MSMRPFRYLVAVADEGSFTRAAQLLHVSQPALSQQIRQLEERLGVPLLDRSGRAVRPTDAGRAFLAHARRALGEAEAADRAARDVEDLSSGTLRVGLTPSFGIYLVAPLIRRFHDAHPGIDLHLIDMSQAGMEAALSDDAIDCGLAFSDVRADEIEWEPLHGERLCLIAAAGHDLARHERIDGATLATLELALLGPGFVTRQTIDAHLARNGIRPSIAVEATSIATIVEIVRGSRLATILPDVLVREQTGLVARPLEPSIPIRRVALLRRRNGYRSAAARAFTAIVHDFARELDTSAEASGEGPAVRRGTPADAIEGTGQPNP